MAARIITSDIEEVKRRTNLADLVGDYVALKHAGIDSLKGLCPFHDERSPSFHVRPSLGYYHCFGCGESGDAFTFLQRMDHLTFVESVERLAARINYVLRYEEGGVAREEGANRARLLAANQLAANYYVEGCASQEGGYARRFLQDRGFDETAVERFGVGYAPKGWDRLTKHLVAQGYTRAELVQAGLVSEGQRGMFDRFRGRIVWPIRDPSGQTLGFGARKLYDDDTGPKYLNTPESPVYHKSRVLYGLDMAKRAISREKRAVIVEGYTDVMACHLAGVHTAVATCGTAFGADHISILRRVLGDESAAEVIFTFDPDTAGQKAALRAFSEERRFLAQTYVATPPEGLDPSDVRLRLGDEAVRELFARKIPLFEFALKQAVSRFNLNSVEGRVQALRAGAPIVAAIKDSSLKPGYTRELARMLGVEVAEVHHAVRSVRPNQLTQTAPHRGGGQYLSGQGDRDKGGQLIPRISLATLQDTPTTRLERDALMAMLQQSELVGVDLMRQAVTAEVNEPQLRVVRDALSASTDALGGPQWVHTVLDAAPESHKDLVRELTIAPMPERRKEHLVSYVRGVIVALLDRDLLSLKRELLARMQRIGDATHPDSFKIQQQLVALEAARRGLQTS